MSGSSGRIHSYKMRKKTLMNTFKEVEEISRHRNFIKTEQGQKHDIRICIYLRPAHSPAVLFVQAEQHRSLSAALALKETVVVD